MVTKTTTKGTAKPAAKSVTPKIAKPTLVHSDQTVVDGDAGEAAADGPQPTKLKDMIDRVTTATGAKRKDVKTIVEATLVQLGASVKASEVLSLPGLGKMRVVRQGPEGSGMVTLKLKLSNPAQGDKAVTEPLADADDQD